MSVQTSLQEVQIAIFTKLAGDATFMALINGVFDFGDVPIGQQFPYVTLGDMNEGPMNAFARRGYLSTITLHIWSSQPGFKQCQQILARMNTLIDQQHLTLATQSHVYTLYQSSHTLNDPGSDGIRHMPVIYELFTQE